MNKKYRITYQINGETNTTFCSIYSLQNRIEKLLRDEAKVICIIVMDGTNK